MNTALKIIRTIIGLPIAVVIWPITIFSLLLTCCIFWVMCENPEMTKDDCVVFLCPPYKFIKKVWK